MEALMRMCALVRRICPARRFADNSVWHAMAGLVATFDICKAKDDMGNDITPEPVFHSGLSRYSHCDLCMLVASHTLECSPPLVFQCTIKPRSAQAVELIRKVN